MCDVTLPETDLQWGESTPIINKANSILGVIRRNFKYLDNEVFIRLFKSLVRPILEYGQTIWAPYLLRQSRSIENVKM